MGCIVLSDAIQSDDNDAPNIVYGDILCLVGSFIYALSNVLQEYLVKDYSRDHYLGYLGLFGTIIAFIQFMIVEYGVLNDATFSWVVILYMAGFTSCMFLIYTNASLFLQDLDSTLFNLSLLTSDVYAVLFSFLVYHSIVHWLYFIAFPLVVIGLLLYHAEESPQQLKKDKTNNNNNNNEKNNMYNPLSVDD